MDEKENNGSQKEKLLLETFDSDNSENKKEKSKKEKNLNFYNESFINKIFFRWTTRVMDLSNNNKLKINDINALHQNQSTRHFVHPLEETWKYYSSVKNSKYPLLRTIFRVHLFQLIQLFIIDFSLQTNKIIRTYFFRQIIFLFSTGNFEGTKWENVKNLSIIEFFKNFQFNIYQCGFLFILTKLVGTVLFHNLEFKDSVIQKRIKNEMTGLLFNKILRGNLDNYDGRGEGEKINLIEVDCEKLGYIFFVGPKIINAPYLIIISLFFLFQLFGFKFIYAMGMLIVLMTFILILQVLYLRNIKKILNKKDQRMKTVTYVFHILKNIKINGWEEEFAKKIKNKRDDELLYIKKNLYIGLIRMLVNSNIPLILLMISIGTNIYSNKALEIANLFTSFQLINQMTQPLMGIPMFLNDFFTNLISIQRLQNFLNSPEHNYKKNENYEKEEILIKYDKATFGINISNVNERKISLGRKRTNDSGRPSLAGIINKEILLHDISLTIKKGEFIAILGPTGSGKSNLINSILNNYKIISSDYPIIINGTLSYAPQQPWIMEDTIKNNIILYNKFDQEKYSKIITACELIKDFETFKKGDESIINSLGGNISGGQKGRISLARCLYKDVDMYLLDDPLANVDTEVSNNIFKNAFVKYLKGKCRILVTHEVNNLNYVDKIILMEKGYIKFIGTYNEFLKQFGNNYVIDDEDDNEDDLGLKYKKSKSKNEENERNNINFNQNNKFISSETQSEKTSQTKDSKKQKNPLALSDNKYKKGKMSFKTYNTFIKLQGGYFIFSLLLLCMIGARFANSFRSIYISSWSKSRKEIEKKEKEEKEIIQEQLNHFYTYVKISLIGIFLNFLIEYIHSSITLYSQRTLHESMVYKFLRAPINLFHDLVPIGQLLNRLTKDIDLIQRIIRGVTNFARALFTITASIFVCYIYSKFTLLLSPILIIMTVKITQYFIGCARNLQRLERISYSPIINILSESIRGVEVIRTAGVEENFREKIYNKLDENFSVHLYLEGSKKWYIQRLRYSSHFFFGIIITYILIRKDIFSPQAIGLILQNSEEFANELANILNFFSNIEISMVSIERCESALNTIEEKKPNQNEEIYIKDGRWPLKGKIEFLNYSTKYRPLTPIILKKLNCTINPGEKIGIVGRTGSGKSTLILSICRILESFDGKILIDDTDISKINLDSLRQNITIVSQDPFILEGTLRENIDPLNKHKEKEILDILDSFNLFKEIINSQRRLNFYIKEGGSNLSIGERQLICFARAALKKSKVVILDEATSAMDFQTENIIQENIDNLFKDYTVIMIAHHIQMVSKCKRIIVIDNGEIVENDSYDNLMENKKSKFYSLYSESLPSKK